jgi:hypothetical protein
LSTLLIAVGFIRVIRLLAGGKRSARSARDT